MRLSAAADTGVRRGASVPSFVGASLTAAEAGGAAAAAARCAGAAAAGALVGASAGAAAGASIGPTSISSCAIAAEATIASSCTHKNARGRVGAPGSELLRWIQARRADPPTSTSAHHDTPEPASRSFPAFSISLQIMPSGRIENGSSIWTPSSWAANRPRGDVERCKMLGDVLTGVWCLFVNAERGASLVDGRQMGGRWAADGRQMGGRAVD